MTIVVWLVGGLVGGFVLERLIGKPKPASTTGSGAAPTRPKRRVGRTIGWLALFGVIALVATAIGGYMWANSIFNKIETVDVSDQLATGGGTGTNYLLVGSDNGKQDGEQREGVAGARSDTIMVLRIEGNRAMMMSLNRDLWVRNPATGANGRLNATYNQGPANLIQAVTENFSIPIHRYMEIDFLSFAGLVDAFGGIDIYFEHPAFDLASGLAVEQSGLVHLNGDQALAFVRSRHYTEVIDGRHVPEGGLPDVNRTGRQQVFLKAIMGKVADSRNPFKLASAADSMSSGLRIDDDMTLLQAARFAWSMGRLNPESVVLPVVPRTTSGGAAVLDLKQPDAEALLTKFR
ncbi:MAG: LCP family protein [Acidimicrobiales bacterium]|nr:LCP family protein [Acidimicrobiales bacterium]